ncbi:type III PLP-dependent enzyme [Kushneria phyllosphaerae]|uniref:L-glutamyl-[BtrI acyl-carrier protein] decarboxylase n=1 Tax=Kushneria phyllosphaerae TaxID=2100822 RepID=A0A2R8CJH2_9GAMM|nr:type III PLP-dependent enzyme [Kushneria phyllosphaerae]SPJ33036.1 L-glutamyl-[BtrI acyl-carrier protein] decarboxylase [Kushneria phyllosphaerae]
MSEASLSTTGCELPPRLRQAILQARKSSEAPMAAFFYDLDALAHHADEMYAALPEGVELYYAIKANSETPVLETLASRVDGFELSSGGELSRAASCATPRPWLLSGPGKLDSELEEAIKRGVSAIHLESLNEIDRLAVLARRLDQVQPVFVRINPALPEAYATRLNMAGRATPFGIDESELPEAIMRIEACDHLVLKGFHIHAMSHQADSTRHAALIAHYLERWPVWRALARYPERLTHLNVGGGLGVDYVHGRHFDWPALCTEVATLRNAMTAPPVVRFEVGRFLSAFCGYYVMEVLDRKTSHGEHFLICRGGTHQFRLPPAQGHDHPVLHLPRQVPPTDEAGRRWSVVGQLCTPKDVLSRGRELGGVSVGDLLVLPLAGAYGYNISHADFLCHPRPRLHFLPVESTGPVNERSLAAVSEAGP